MSKRPSIATLSLFQKGIILVAVTLGFELVFLATLTALLKQSNEIGLRQTEAKEAIARANQIYKSAYDGTLSLFAYKLTRSKSYIARYDEQSVETANAMHRLKISTADNPQLRQQVLEITLVNERLRGLLDGLRRDLESGRLSLSEVSSAAWRSELQQLTDRLVVELHKFTEMEEKIVLADPESEARSNAMVYQCIGAGVVLNILLAVCLAILFHRSTTRRLDVLLENTALLSHRKPLNAPLTGDDELARLDRTFHEMADALSDLERRKQDFFRMISHDLRSPLTSIQAYLAGVKGGIFDNNIEKLKLRAGQAESSATKMIGLVSSILDIEKMEAGEFLMDKAMTSLDNIVKSSLESLRDLAEKQGVTLESGASPYEVCVDAVYMEQVITNLVSNAIKFSPKGSSVVVQASELEHCIEVKVRDSGRGIPADHLESVFERFKQVSKLDGRDKRGTGLGLPICKAIVEAHGGSIGVESDGKTGSTFWFRIPRQKVEMVQ